MKEVKTKFVSIELNEDKTCKRVLLCKNLTEDEYNALLNEEAETKEKEKHDKQELVDNIQELYTQTKNQDLFIAKATYDNFVDRGLIEEDNEFQQAWYDFVFGGAQLEYVPDVFKTILAKVGGDL